MALRIKSSQDFWTGCAFTAFGAGTAVLSQAHPLGSAARMGPGYFPTVLGVPSGRDRPCGRCSSR